MDNFSVPYLSYDNIRKQANNFLSRYNPSGEIPVDIEHIIEIDLGINLIPILGLTEAFNTIGFISRDFQSISIDKRIYETVETRCRFTLAHEIGHMILHRDIWEALEFSNISEWKQAESSVDAKKYQYLEYQANKFAGLVLVPSPKLNELFEEAKAIVIEQGFDLSNEAEMVYGYIHRSIAQKFFVSEEAVRYRCEYEELR